MVTLGSEYANLKSPAPNRRDQKRIDRVIDKINSLSNDEIDWVYKGGTGIFTPIYYNYARTFFENILQYTDIKKDFADFRDTSIYERYMLNSCQFSAAKSASESKVLQSLVFDENGTRVGFSAFKKEAKAAVNIINDTWLRTEYDMSVRQAVTGDQFRRYRKDADIYPYWRYLMTSSLHPRDEHLLLVGSIYKIGDPNGDRVAPPNGWNCGCGTEQLADFDMDNEGVSARTADQAKEDLQLVSPQFRFNPADQGILPKESHSYFEALPNANAANGNTFNISGSPKRQTGLASKGLAAMLELVDHWRHENHSDHKTITFQCPELYTNVIFNDASLSSISHNSAGFDMLDDTIKSPDEVWSYWLDVDKQESVYRNYIKGNYVVTTLNGTIKNARMVENIEAYRTGVLVL